MAGRHLSESLFDRLAREVENLFFVYVITREATRTFERNFAQWAAELRRVQGDVELTSLIRKSFAQERAKLAARFDDAFRRLDAGSVQFYRLQYILAKLTQHIELAAYGETEGTKWLSTYTSGGFEIEYIFPQTPGDKAKLEFGTITDANVADKLGNLLLVEKSINSSLGNQPFSKKRAVYGQSRLLFTRAIGERPKVGANTKIDAAVANINPFDHWNEASIANRQNSIRDLADVIWDVPATAEI